MQCLETTGMIKRLDGVKDFFLSNINTDSITYQSYKCQFLFAISLPVTLNGRQRRTDENVNSLTRHFCVNLWTFCCCCFAGSMTILSLMYAALHAIKSFRRQFLFPDT